MVVVVVVFKQFLVCFSVAKRRRRFRKKKQTSKTSTQKPVVVWWNFQYNDEETNMKQPQWNTHRAQWNDGTQHRAQWKGRGWKIPFYTHTHIYFLLEMQEKEDTALLRYIIIIGVYKIGSNNNNKQKRTTRVCVRREWKSITNNEKKKGEGEFQLPPTPPHLSLYV